MHVDNESDSRLGNGKAARIFIVGWTMEHAGGGRSILCSGGGCGVHTGSHGVTRTQIGRKFRYILYLGAMSSYLHSIGVT